MAPRSDEAFHVVWPKIEIFSKVLDGKISIDAQTEELIKDVTKTVDSVSKMYKEDLFNTEWAEVDKFLENCADTITSMSNLITSVYMDWLKEHWPENGGKQFEYINHLQMVDKCKEVRGKNYRKGYYE